MKAGKRIQVLARWNKRNQIYCSTWNNQGKKEQNMWKPVCKYYKSVNKGQWSKDMRNKQGKPYHCPRLMPQWFRNDNLRGLRWLKFSGLCRIIWRFAEGLQLQIFRLLFAKLSSPWNSVLKKFTIALITNTFKKTDSWTKHVIK